MNEPRDDAILSQPARDFLADLHHHFESRRRELLARRIERQQRIDGGEMPRFRDDTAEIRQTEWTVAPPPQDLVDRRVEITGPVDRKMMINALNSGARVFMADFEDANSPTWSNVLDGQTNLIDAIARTIEHDENGKQYRLNDEVATLMVRPRGWHLVERHFTVGSDPISASLFDFGLYMFHNATAATARGTGPYFYLPKLEGHLEARLWNDVFIHTQDALGIPRGTIKATVLIENILAAFEMDEILFELREHSAGLNAGRWDYIFSVIKKLRNQPGFVLPDRGQITMTVPFMRAYTELLVATCHRRGAHAIGGMAAFIPSRRDPEVTERALAGVRADKEREANDGFDGTWVAHPDLVPVARDVFDAVLESRPNQVERSRSDVTIEPEDLLDTAVPGGTITEEGLRTNIRVGILYIASWLRGTGAAALFNLMEDAATAEISRSQVWQWVHGDAVLHDGTQITAPLVRKLADDEMQGIRDAVGTEAFAGGRFDDARNVFEQVALADDFVDFLTIPAYDLID